MVTASEYYKTKPVNNVNQKWLSPTEVEITIYKEGWKKSHTCTIKDYGMPTERVTKDQEIEE